MIPNIRNTDVEKDKRKANRIISFRWIGTLAFILFEIHMPHDKYVKDTC